MIAPRWSNVKRDSGRARPAGARTPTLLAAAVAAMLLAACGSSASPTATTTAGSSATATTSAGSGGSGGSAGGLDFSKLGSLTDYAASMTDNGVTISVQVSSPTNWSESTGGPYPILHIDGTTYTRSVDSHGSPVWYSSVGSSSNYQQSPYPGAVAQFTDFRKVAGATVTKGAPCTEAGVAGHDWTIASPHTATLSEGETACVADSSGALLSFGSTASGSAVPSSGFSYSLTVTQVGGVQPVSVPSPVVPSG